MCGKRARIISVASCGEINVLMLFRAGRFQHGSYSVFKVICSKTKSNVGMYLYCSKFRTFNIANIGFTIPVKIANAGKFLKIKNIWSFIPIHCHNIFVLFTRSLLGLQSKQGLSSNIYLPRT